MMDRGQEIRELKLGASFTHPNNRTGYHTVKYDFKPASVDAHKEATLETGSNKQVTVTVPHLDGSGTPNTIFKGNQRDYTKKECVLIFNRETNEIILEKLCSNIAVKKTRADTSNKLPSAPPQAPLTQQASAAANQAAITKQENQAATKLEYQAANTKLENQTTRHSTKTRVSTGIRKNVLNFVPKHSPLQGSPSYPHKSPQQAPSWNANSSTSTLPSIPSLLDDNFVSNQPQSSVMYNKNNSSNNNSSTSSSSSTMLMPKASSAISTQHLQQQTQQQQQSHQMVVDDIGVLSSSESSSDSNDSDSDSDSGDSIDNHPTTAMSSNNMNNMNNMVNHRSNISNINGSSMNNSNNNININNNNNNNGNHNHKKGNHLDNNSAALLSKDLCLSDSNSDSDF